MTSTCNDNAGSSIALSSSNEDVRFNNKDYGGWKSARAGYLSVTQSVKVGSVWETIEMSDMDEGSPFVLRVEKTAIHHASLENH
jgi:hypothetical protein